VAIYTLPTFNLLCNIKAAPGAGWGAAAAAVAPPYRLTNQACALVYGRRVNLAVTSTTLQLGFPMFTMNLLLPAGTDIRGIQETTGIVDVVECPAGSGRWYRTAWVDDIGKGWANEHRSAVIQAVPGSWASPYP